MSTPRDPTSFRQSLLGGLRERSPCSLCVRDNAPASALIALHPRFGQLVRVHAASSVLAWRLELQPLGIGVLVHSDTMAVEGAHAREVATARAAKVEVRQENLPGVR